MERLTRREFLNALCFVTYLLFDASRSNTPMALLLPRTISSGDLAVPAARRLSSDRLSGFTLAGFGDSNMVGGVEPGSISPLNFVHRLVKVRSGIDLPFENFGQVGAESDKVLREQVLADDTKDKLKDKKVIGVLNLGGNDLLKIVENSENSAAFASLSQNPYTFELLNLAAEIYRGVNQFGQEFNQLLDTLVTTYPQVEYLAVIGFSNYSQVSEIRTREVEGREYSLPLSEWHIKKLVKGVSLLMRNQMVTAVSNLKMGHPDLSTLFVDTFDFDGSFFIGDEHFGPKGKSEIAERVYRGLLLSSAY